MALNQTLTRVSRLRGIALAGSLLLLTVFGGAASSRSADSAAPPGQVGISNFAFDPPMLTVKPGTTVTWVNHDDEPHTVTSTTGAFGSQALDTDESFSFHFDAPGTYAYRCGIHPHMTGTIVVR
jgi:plastocyanin